MEAIARAAGITKRSLYARYPDKRAVFADVIPWALARYTDDGSIDEIDEDDLETALLAVGRVALARATHPENVPPAGVRSPRAFAPAGWGQRGLHHGSAGA